MKLGALKTAIRELTVAPKVMMKLGDHVIQIDAQKTPLLAQLDKTFPGGRTQETGLHVRDDGFLMNDNS